MATTDLMTLQAPVANLSQYSLLVESYPRLDETKECELANRLRRENDLEAARQLILSNLRQVVYIARGYTGYGLPTEDLIQEGNIGLMKAVRRFDPSRSVRLASYAALWIRAEIHDFILRNWRIVKCVTTKARRKLFYKLRSMKKQLQWLNSIETEDIADALEVDTGDVRVMEGQLYLDDMPFDGTAQTDDEYSLAPAEFIQDCSTDPERQVSEFQLLDLASDVLADAMDGLDARSRDIVESRWLAEEDKKLTLQVLGDRYGISAERVRQLENEAIRAMQDAVVSNLGVERCESEQLRRRNPIAV